MRISELAAASGISVATLKFYLRERLLAPGTPRAVNQADYDSSHLQRVRLIRALTEIGELRLRQVRAIVAAIDDTHVPLHDLLGIAQYALEGEDEAPGPPSEAVDAVDAALVDDVLAELGWNVNRDAPARRSLARTLGSLRRLGWNVTAADVARYGRAIDGLAADEVETLRTDGSRADAVERLVTGTILFEAVLIALRRLAQERHAAARFAASASAGSIPRP